MLGDGDLRVEGPGIEVFRIPNSVENGSIVWLAEDSVAVIVGVKRLRDQAALEIATHRIT